MLDCNECTAQSTQDSRDFAKRCGCCCCCFHCSAHAVSFLHTIMMALNDENLFGMCALFAGPHPLVWWRSQCASVRLIANVPHPRPVADRIAGDHLRYQTEQSSITIKILQA